MTYKGHVRNGVIVLDEPADLPEGAAVDVELTEPARTLGDLMRDVAGKGRDLPEDGSIQHDHYIYGTPKR